MPNYVVMNFERKYFYNCDVNQQNGIWVLLDSLEVNQLHFSHDANLPKYIPKSSTIYDHDYYLSAFLAGELQSGFPGFKPRGFPKDASAELRAKYKTLNRIQSYNDDLKGHRSTMEHGRDPSWLTLKELLEVFDSDTKIHIHPDWQEFDKPLAEQLITVHFWEFRTVAINKMIQQLRFDKKYGFDYKENDI